MRDAKLHGLTKCLLMVQVACQHKGDVNLALLSMHSRKMACLKLQAVAGPKGGRRQLPAAAGVGSYGHRGGGRRW